MLSTLHHQHQPPRCSRRHALNTAPQGRRSHQVILCGRRIALNTAQQSPSATTAPSSDSEGIRPTISDASEICPPSEADGTRLCDDDVAMACTCGLLCKYLENSANAKMPTGSSVYASYKNIAYRTQPLSKKSPT